MTQKQFDTLIWFLVVVCFIGAAIAMWHGYLADLRAGREITLPLCEF